MYVAARSGKGRVNYVYGAPVPARAVGMAVHHPQSPLTAPDAPEAPETCERTKPRHGQMVGQLPPKVAQMVAYMDALRPIGLISTV